MYKDKDRGKNEQKIPLHHIKFTHNCRLEISAQKWSTSQEASGSSTPPKTARRISY